MESLNFLDASFIDAEDQDRHASYAIASIAVFEGPAPSYEEFVAALAARLPLVPIYRRKLRKIPLGLGLPVWVDDPHFDIRYHVRHTALPAPGGDEQLAGLMARVMAQRLDRDFPLWEYWLVEGLHDDRWGLISKVHHSMVDGVSGTDLYRVIFDATPESPPPAAPVPPPASEPSDLSLATRAALDLTLLPWRNARALGEFLARPGEAVRQVTDTARAAAMLAGSLASASNSSLVGPIGRQRRYTWARASLADVKTIKKALGGTVNDVVLAAISGGFRSLLISRGERPERHAVPSLVPVSLRAPGEEGIYENRVSAIVIQLPVDIGDPAERLAAVRAQMSRAKAGHEALASAAAVSLSRFTISRLASTFVRLAVSLPQREIVTVTTNVPGPDRPLYGLGRRLVEIIPYVPIATTVRTGVSILSYDGQLAFGLTGDYATTADLAVLGRGIEAAVAELLAVATAPDPGTPAPAPAEVPPAGAPAAPPPAAAGPRKATGRKRPAAPGKRPSAPGKRPAASGQRPAATRPA